MFWLLLGSIPGVLFTSRFAVRLPDGALRVGLGTVLLASGIRLLEVPHYEILVPLVLVAGAASAVLTQVRLIQARTAAET
jgi:uncharacterized protein